MKECKDIFLFSTIFLFSSIALKILENYILQFDHQNFDHFKIVCLALPKYGAKMKKNAL